MVDRSLFWEGLEKLYSIWQRRSPTWGGDHVADALLIVCGVEDEDILYSKTKSLTLFLLKYELSNCALLFTEREVTFLCSKSIARVLSEVGESPNEEFKIKLDVVMKPKNNPSESEKIVEKMRAKIKGSYEGKHLGMVTRDEAKGKFVKAYLPQLTKGFETVDISKGLAEVLVVKSEAALEQMKKSAEISTKLLRYFVKPQIENIISDELEETHESLADKAEEVLQGEGGMKKIKVKGVGDDDVVEPCYNPIIQSGGRYDHRANAISETTKVHTGDGSIIVRLGVMYNNWCSNIARTYLLNASPFHMEAYNLLTETALAARRALKPGEKLNSVWNAAQKCINARGPRFAPFFTRDCGTSIGLEFSESQYKLNAKGTRVIKEGMVFNLAMGFSGLPFDGKGMDEPDKVKSAKSRKFAVFLADTVVVEAGAAEAAFLTHAKRAIDQVAWTTEEDDDDMDDEEEEDPTAGAQAKRKTRKDKAEDLVTEDESRRKKVAEIARKKTEEALRRLAEGKVASKFNSNKKLGGKFQAYSRPRDMPTLKKRANAIHVDSEAEAVLLPIHQQLVPFHISTIKNVYKTDEGKSTQLRVAFLTPSTKGDISNIEQLLSFSDQKQKWIRELTYRSSGSSLDEAFYAINELRKRFKERLKDMEDKETTVEQKDLILDKSGEQLRMKDVNIRPSLNKRRAEGTLSVHKNGMRFRDIRTKDKVDIIFENVQSAIFQDAQPKDTSIFIHFVLKNPIILSSVNNKKKKTKYVQFYVNVMDAVDDLGTSHYDEALAMEEEEAQRKRKKRLNDRYTKFTKEIEKRLRRRSDGFEFDAPYRNLAFSGVAYREMVPLLPATHSLLSLGDNPPFAMLLKDVEVVVFQRITQRMSLINFDMTFIMSDLKTFQTISLVPKKFLASVKDWLVLCKLPFYEVEVNYKWGQFLKEIRDLGKTFYEDGGWSSYFNQEGDDGEESEEEEDPDDEYVPSSDASDDDEDSEYESEIEESDDDYPDEVSDEGENWEELERKARESDRRKGSKFGRDDDDEGYSRKKRSSTSSRPSSSAGSSRVKKRQRR
jgi:nucleosome binding factor SPN SPT16 subunit